MEIGLCNRNIFMIFVLLFVFTISSIYADSNPESFKVKKFNSKDYVSLYDFTENSDVDYYFNVVTQRGTLFYKGHKAVFQPGFSIMVVDGKLYSANYQVIRVKGEIFIPSIIFKSILRHFFTKTVYVRQGNAFVKNKDAKPVELKPLKNQKEPITFIVIDAGHGGKDPGALGKDKSYEKTITLNVAKKLASYLKKNLKNVKVVLTRSNDKFVELGKRTEIANKLLSKGNNGLFISIHVNASLSSKVSGFETYFLSQNASNEEARATAALENNVLVLENKSHKPTEDADYVEALMLTTQIQAESKMLAEKIQQNLSKKISNKKNRGVKKADFFVLRGVLMPAALVEIGYMTNRSELKLLKTSNYQDKVANSVGYGIKEFIYLYNKGIGVK